jgi:DNA-binding NtrC family response regulator
MPSLKERKEDIHLLFRKFAADFADKYRIPAIRLNEEAVDLLESYSWPGNIRQLKNICEQISAVEQNRSVSKETLSQYIPKENATPVLFGKGKAENDFSEREILYKVLFDMKNDLNDLKRVTKELMDGNVVVPEENKLNENFIIQPKEEVSQNLAEKEKEILTLQEQEKILIEESLIRHQGRRKDAAEELGISERTLYRKIKEYLL